MKAKKKTKLGQALIESLTDALDAERNKMKLYVTQMYRWGNEDGHSYIEGVYDSLEQAEKHGAAEKLSRANKYEFKAWVHPLNEPRRLKYMTDAEIQEAMNTPELNKIKEEFNQWYDEEEE